MIPTILHLLLILSISCNNNVNKTLDENDKVLKELKIKQICYRKLMKMTVQEKQQAICSYYKKSVPCIELHDYDLVLKVIDDIIDNCIKESNKKDSK